MQQPDPVFPPLMKGHAVRSPLAPFDEACRRAEHGVLGAGDLVWARRHDRAELALILEPDVPGLAALQMVPLAAVATADALGQLMPPQVAVEHRWPGTIVVNGGAAGSIRAAISNIDPDQPARWLVVAITLVLRTDRRGREPGEAADETTLAEEGGGEVTRSDLIEAIAKHLLVWINTWSEEGFRKVAEQWLFRAEHREGGGGRPRLLGLDEEAGLVATHGDGATSITPLAPHVQVGFR